MLRDTAWEPGTPCWVDLSSPDPDAAERFYGELLGWRFTEPAAEFGGYRNADRDGHLVAGLMPLMAPGQPTAWTVHIASADAQATCAAIVDAGGSVLAEPMPVGDLGVLAVAVDPGGAHFGVWQAGAHLGSTLVNEPGGVTWTECLTNDYETVTAFYARVFGYDLAEIGGDAFRYSTTAVDGRVVGGICLDSGQTPGWRTYFSVDDTDGAVATVQRLGGSVVQPAMDSPFGRWSVVADPFGARFCVIVPPAGATGG